MKVYTALHIPTATHWLVCFDSKEEAVKELKKYLDKSSGSITLCHHTLAGQFLFDLIDGIKTSLDEFEIIEINK